MIINHVSGSDRTSPSINRLGRIITVKLTSKSGHISHKSSFELALFRERGSHRSKRKLVSIIHIISLIFSSAITVGSSPVHQRPVSSIPPPFFMFAQVRIDMWPVSQFKLSTCPSLLYPDPKTCTLTNYLYQPLRYAFQSNAIR